MNDLHWTWTIARRIPSERGAGKEVAERILDQLAQLEWEDRDIFGIRLALEEALVNAIVHGNRLDDAKQVTVDCKLSGDRFWIRIEDEGCGFEPGEVPDPTAPENLERPCGRGIMLMRNFMNRVEYSCSGCCVEMEKQRGVAPALD